MELLSILCSQFVTKIESCGKQTSARRTGAAYSTVSVPAARLKALCQEMPYSNGCWFLPPVFFVMMKERALRRNTLHKRHKNQNVDGGRNHSADNRRGDGFHHVRADSAFPKDRYKAGKHREDRHQLRAKPLHCPSTAASSISLFVIWWPEAMIKCFIRYTTKTTPVSTAIPNSAMYPTQTATLKLQPRSHCRMSPQGHGVKRWKNEHESFGDGMKDHMPHSPA